MKLLIVPCLVFALVAVGECQDLTQLMFQAMGIEAPMLPPTMPQSLREHLYPRHRQQQLLQQQQLLKQKQRYLAYLVAQQQRQAKGNPYSIQQTSIQRVQPRANSVYSSANRIRHPGSANSVSATKSNPYSRASHQSTAITKATNPKTSGNPYSVSRGPAQPNPLLRNRAALAPVPISPQALRMMRTMQTMKAVREQPIKVTDAQSAGCVTPNEMLMFADCRNPASVMMCQAEMMSCVNVGVSAMCCPHGINNLALDTIGYVNKMQTFMEGFA